MTSGSGPMCGRLAAYRAGQPPRTANRAAMPDNVSPGCTTYLAAEGAARAGPAAKPPSLARVAFGSFATRNVASAGAAAPLLPAAAPMFHTQGHAETRP